MAAFDVSVTSPTQEAFLLCAAKTAATAIDVRKTNKNWIHFENCRAQGIFFQPLVVETFGGWDPVAADFLKELYPSQPISPSWPDGRKIAFYVSVTSPTQEALLFRAADTAATAIESRKASKNRTHFEHCRAEGVFFQALVVESFGGWDPVATTFLKKLATQEARRWGKTPAMEIKHFFQRLSIALQRGNAALLIARDFDPSYQR